MDRVLEYLRDLRDDLRQGVPETSGYPALKSLLNATGRDLVPQVQCIVHPKGRGAGLPDAGLYSREHGSKDIDPATILGGRPPDRGVVEVKGLADDLDRIIESEQARKYLQAYGLLLVTNYWAFSLYEVAGGGRPRRVESFRLAGSAVDFRRALRSPHGIQRRDGDRFAAFLERVLRHRAPLESPRDVAWYLASYAREAAERLEGRRIPAMEDLRDALQQGLGLTFQGEEGEHFFRSSLVQTLFYGLFSAWVLWARQEAASGAPPFDWRGAAHRLKVPMIQALFHRLSGPRELKALGMEELLDSATAALNRVHRGAFFQAFSEGHAVQYFYEPFLQFFDAALRKSLGVWYTPPEIVRYMVGRVDRALREELGLQDGLADPSVVVLDPCCGTGSFLVETLRRIHTTLEAKGAGALAGDLVRRAACERVFGFEILPAPFVVAHLQVGLLLQTLGSSLDDDGSERAGIFLTNALTGWEPPSGVKQKFIFGELEGERDAAEHIKREARVLVVLGNPPYNAYAGVSPTEEHGLVDVYKEGLSKDWGVKKFNLDDLYVRFFRLAERRIAELTGRGIVCFISNISWLADPSFVVLRKHLLESFDRFWIDNLHGNRRISEYGPDGKTSETVFAMAGFSPGIRQGVAVSTWVRPGNELRERRVACRDDIDASKAEERRAQLCESLTDPRLDTRYEAARPSRENRFLFRPHRVSRKYQSWPRVVDLCRERPSNGLMEKRRGALVAMDRDALAGRLQMYFDGRRSLEDLRESLPGLSTAAARFDPAKARERCRAAEAFSEDRLCRFLVRPFDAQWCYYTPVRPVWNEPRPALWAQCWEGNQFILTRMKSSKEPEGAAFHWARGLFDDGLMTHAVGIPVWVRHAGRTKAGSVADDAPLFGARVDLPGTVPNLSDRAIQYLRSVGVRDPGADLESAPALWHHVLATGYSPQYLRDNADGIQQDWPRIPLPADPGVFRRSVALGRRLASLLDVDSVVEGVTSGRLAAWTRVIAVPAFDTEHASITAGRGFPVTAGWGHRGKGGVIMPGKGRVVLRDLSTEERDALRSHPHGAARARVVGPRTLDIHLSEGVYLRNVPRPVWEFTVGGYQVMKKWLSYREEAILGRPIRGEELETLQSMARRLLGIVLMAPDLDQSYQESARPSRAGGG